MATVEVQKEDVLTTYADEQYKKLQREKNQYISLDEYCAKRGIEWTHFKKWEKLYLSYLCRRSMSKSSDQITTGRESKKAEEDQKNATKKVTISKETESKSV